MGQHAVVQECEVFSRKWERIVMRSAGIGAGVLAGQHELVHECEWVSRKWGKRVRW